MREFDDTDSYPVERWIADFEDAATMFQWNELQKLVFAKKTFKGIAKLFLQSEGVIKTWKKIKELMIKEFATKVSSVQIHKIMGKRQIRKSETVKEFFLAMKELAARGDIENDALFEYVISGLNDEPSNKVVLYGAETVREFKERIKVYDKIRADATESTKTTNFEKEGKFAKDLGNSKRNFDRNK